eukprot:3016207-Pleurochrysis_carterae.AAC.1
MASPASERAGELFLGSATGAAGLGRAFRVAKLAHGHATADKVSVQPPAVAWVAHAWRVGGDGERHQFSG